MSFLQIGVSLYFLYGELGYSALVGFCVMLLLIPCNYVISRYQKKRQVKLMQLKDKRMKIMNEIIGGMKVSSWRAILKNWLPQYTLSYKIPYGSHVGDCVVSNCCKTRSFSI